MKKKLTSRKLWAAIVGVITGLAMVFGLDQDTITTVAGAVTSVGSVVTYIIVEGRVDREAIATAVTNVQGAVETVSKDSDGKS